MKKSIFAKYFTVCSAIVLATMLLLGITMMGFGMNFLQNESTKLLLSNTKEISQIASLNYKSNEYQYIDGDLLKDYIDIVSGAINGEIFITDRDGDSLVCSCDDDCIHQDYVVDSKVLESALQGQYKGSTSLGGLHKDNFLMVGVPLTSDGGDVLGYVFATTPQVVLHDYYKAIFNIFLISGLIALLVLLVASYFVASTMVKPLKDMSNVAKKYSRGEFSVRVAEYGEDEVGNLAKLLNNLGQSLATMETTNRNFIANVSHELKTPMTTISGFIDGILDGTIEKEKQPYYLTIISNEVKRMSRMVISMLNLARIEAGELKVQKTQFDAVDIICQSVFSFEKKIEEKNLQIEGLDHDPVTVFADKDLLHQVVYNLTENAVKFANEGGCIWFDFWSEANTTYVSIKNSGQGMSKEELPHIFDRFYKTDKSRGLDKSGVGLGLYIVKSVINLHGGDIMVRSASGEYTEFVFSLPAQKSKRKE
ncbi:MAG: HAMP domain-containing histidine kinase [Oscillospiraceae bacterium]|nr:HAMP domain-containing histidine kinase [Oscillospiraceae bacterium]